MTGKARLDALTEADFPVVAALATTIWHAHYATIISVAQIEYMLAGRHTPENLHRYLQADDRWMYLLRLSGTPVGYCSWARTTTPHEMKLEQLYLLEEHRGQGLGGLMLRHIEHHARLQKCRQLSLQVNRQNTAAIAVYQNAGFTVREAIVLDIGQGFAMDDFVMVKAL
jgi:ribosomal protein S18 acetylase RimI-like enzyme